MLNLNHVYNITSGEKNWSFVVRDTEFQFIEKYLTSLEEFEAALVKKLTLARIIKTDFNSIKEITRSKDNQNFFITTDKKWSADSISFKFNNSIDSANFINHILNKFGYIETQKTLSTKWNFVSYGFIVLVAIGLTWQGLLTVANAENGITVYEDTGGKNSWAGLLLHNFYLFLGRQGVWIVGIISIGLILFNCYKSYKNPGTETVYLNPAFKN